MKPELSIKLDYLANRENPAEVFEAMALYINAYKSFGQLMCNSVGVKTDFEFMLNDIERSSILSKLTALPQKIDAFFEEAFYKAGNKSFQNLLDTEQMETEEEVEAFSADVETHIAEELPAQIADPHIDRHGMAVVLEMFSNANMKMRRGESVLLRSSAVNDSVPINTSWRFTGNVKEMFLGTTESHTLTDKLYIAVAVNKGNAVWKFDSKTFNKAFTGRIADKQWLEQYQAGLIPAVGPKDLMIAQVSLDMYTPPKGKGNPQIRNAKILKVIDIERNNGHQYEFSV